jgi:succinyl-CoA synthetase beta subunit
MKLHEYQSKKLFNQIGIPIPKSKIIHKTENIRDIFNQFNGAALLKAQVLTGGRGKEGGIRLARSENEAENITAFLLNSKIHDYPINKVMIEELIDFDEGFSIGIYFNRRKGLAELRGSPSTKFWQREKIYQNPLLDIFTLEIDPIIGIHIYKILIYTRFVNLLFRLVLRKDIGMSLFLLLKRCGIYLECMTP